MTGADGTIDVAGGMAWAIMAPALAGALIALVAGPGVAVVVFAAALSIAGLHVVLLALPLYGLLRVVGWRVTSGTALGAAGLIGALPTTLPAGPGLGVWGGLFGLIGGVAFCAMSIVRGERNE